jgi:class 3 adenylate cyclase
VPELPKGTVTFLFTDVEGSTRLLRQLGDRYRDVMIQGWFVDYADPISFSA